MPSDTGHLLVAVRTVDVLEKKRHEVGCFQVWFVIRKENLKQFRCKSYVKRAICRETGGTITCFFPESNSIITFCCRMMIYGQP